MTEIVEGSYGPWYAHITLVDGEYHVILKADKVKTFLVKDRPRLRLTDSPEEQTVWKFPTLKAAVRFGKRELSLWKRKEKKLVKKHIAEMEFTEMRIY